MFTHPFIRSVHPGRKTEDAKTEAILPTSQYIGICDSITSFIPIFNNISAQHWHWHWPTVWSVFFWALPGDIPSESPVQRTRVDHWYLELGCRSPGGATVTSLALRCLDLGPWFQFLILLVGFKTKPLLEPRLENLDVLTSPHCSKNQQWLLQSFDYLNPKIGSIHNNRSFRQDRQSTSKTKRMWQGRRAWRGSGIKCQFTLLTNKLITPTAALNFIDTRTWAFQCIHQGSSGPNIGAVERDLQRLKETWLHLGSTVLEFFITPHLGMALKLGVPNKPCLWFSFGIEHD